MLSRDLFVKLPKLMAVIIFLTGFMPLCACQAQEMPPSADNDVQSEEIAQEAAYEEPQPTPQMYEESYGDSYQSLAANMTRLTWQHDLKTSLSLAKHAQKLVLIDFYTDWCGWCKRLDRDVYANARIAQFVDSQFVPLKLNAEDNGEGQAFAKKLEIRGYPCTVVLDSNGKVKGMFYGYRKPAEFPAELTKAAGLQPNTPM
jgi:thiol:disulfide interchange protein